MKIKYVIQGWICWLLFSFPGISAQYFIAPYEPVYEDLRYLQTLNYLGGLDLNRLPILNTELVNIPSEFDSSSDHTYKLATKVYDGFRPEIDTDLHKELFIRIGARLDLNYNHKFYPQLRTIGNISPARNIYIVNIMTLDPYAGDNPNYLGKEWRGMSGYTEQAYLTWQTNMSRLTFGRSYIVNGPGRNANLLFSGTSRPMDHVRMELMTGGFKFQSGMAQLDDMNGNSRYLAYHSLSGSFRHLYCAISEVILYGGSGRNPELAYLNPFIFFHGVQNNGPNMAGNTLGTLELAYQGRHWVGYGEFMIDDIQLDHEEPGDLEPNELGMVLGIDLADPFKIPGLYAGLEYVALTNRTYKTANNYEWYLHRNVPIGYAPGSDLDRWNLYLKKYLANWQLILELDYLRRGEGDMDKPWDTPWMEYTVEEGYSEPFPTGIVEKTVRTGLELRWLRTYRKCLFARIDFEQIRNYNHTTKKRSDAVLSAGLRYDFLGIVERE